MPRSVPEPVRSSTANVSTTGVMPSPNTDTLWAMKTLRKSRERSRPAPSRRRAGMSRTGTSPRVYDSSVAPRAAQSAMIPVSVANPKVTAKPTTSAVPSQPVFSSERIDSNT